MSTNRPRAPRPSSGRPPASRRAPAAAPRAAASRRAAAPRRPAARPAPSRRPARARRGGRGRLLLVLVVLLGIGALIAVAVVPRFREAVDEIRSPLPLRHADIIRQQAAAKGLDPALVAAVIYAESRFRDNQESSAGALGLMQLTPATASDIAKESGASAFNVGDLHTADVNIRYGTWRLRDMLRRFDGNTALAMAGYNAGPENAKKWRAEAAAEGRPFTVARIPFPETRNYVEKVLDAQRDYRKTYAKQLGLG